MNIMDYQLAVLKRKFDRLHDEVIPIFPFITLQSLNTELEERNSHKKITLPIKTGLIKW